MKDFLDDKIIVIVSVLFLGLAVIFTGEISPEKTTILTGIFSGLFGIAVGKLS